MAEKQKSGWRSNGDEDKQVGGVMERREKNSQRGFTLESESGKKKFNTIFSRNYSL